MLGEDARRILHRHRIAGEGHHAGAEFEVQVVERGLEQVGGHRGLSRVIFDPAREAG